MNLSQLISKVRAHARDFNGTIFRREDIILFLNEAIDRVIQVMPQLENIPYLEYDTDIVRLIPREYVHLLTNYSTSRLFAQDERHYEATTMMNEFEVKLAEFKEKVDNGEIEIIDPDTGEPLKNEIPTDYVVDTYFYKTKGSSNNDIEEG